MANTTEFEHVSVLLEECIENLCIEPSKIYMDGTAGGAGHSLHIAKRLTTGMLYSLDRDPTAVKVATERLAGLQAKVVHSNFSQAKAALSEQGVFKIDGALLDLGVSSHQLDEAERGFSYRTNAPLDMRMSDVGQTAADVVNTYTRESIAKILREYGEEPNAWSIAGKIVNARELQPILTTDELAQCVASAVPAAVRRKEKHPARRTFQALRIHVNGELDHLDTGLDEIFEMLNPGGRLCVITFHSLEDRLVKQRFKQWAVSCTCPPEFPVCTCGGKARAKIITKKPILPSDSELEVNRRSRSAKLRVVQKI